MPTNPFKADIYPDGLPAHAGENLMHAKALEELRILVDQHTSSQSPEGTVILLKSPRAGYGKSHLLAAFGEKFDSTAFVISPTFDPSAEFRFKLLFQGVINHGHGTRPKADGSLTLLDRLSRQVFAMLNAELIATKQIPCAHPASAIQALRDRSLELFDLNDPRQAVGQWFVEHFERLLPLTSGVLSESAGIGPEAATVWLRALCAYTQGESDGDAQRGEHLHWSLEQGNSKGVMAGGMNILTAPNLDESYFRDRLVQLLRLYSLVQPVVLVVDHLDAVHGNAAQTMRVATAITELRRLLPRVVVVVSMNQDLWSGSFQKFVPSALEDRLSGEKVQLGEINAAQGNALMEERMRAFGISKTEADQFLANFQLPQLYAREPGRYSAPRALLRHAARAWDDWCKRKSSRAPIPVADRPETPSFPGTDDETQPEGTASFQQLKTMLEKLRLERIATGRPLEVASESGVILHGTAESPFVTVTEAPTHVPTEKELIESRFHQLRQRLLGAKPLRVDQDLLCHLLEFGGKRLAIVKAAHIPVPGSSGPGAVLWLTPDGEILFGSEAHQDRAYWQALLAYVQNRHTATQPLHSHLAIFSAVEDPVDLQRWLSASETESALKRYVDIIPLEPEALATLYAADEMLHNAEHGDEETICPEEVFTVLSPYLDSFWQRLIRVLA